MKKLIMILLISTIIFASKQDTERRIYQTILYAIFPSKKEILVWSDANNLIFLENIKNVKIARNYHNADILILQKQLPSDVKVYAPIFTRNYHLLKLYKNDAIGGFYWQKGRPNILFLEKNLEKYHIILPHLMDQYIENQL